jgi:L-arabinose isomerase
VVNVNTIEAVDARHSFRVALCGIGLDAYWDQFNGLENRLKGYVARVAARLARPGVDVVNLGLADTPMRSQEAGHQCRREDIGLLFLYVTTYALSNTVLPLVQRAGVPVVVLNLQPEAAIDYEAINQLQDRTAMTGEWLAFCSACPVPEIANPFQRAHIPFHQVTGAMDDEEAWREIEEWLAAARVRTNLISALFALMGHYYSGMLDIVSDVTLLSIVFRIHAEFLEVDELSALRVDIAENEFNLRVEEFHTAFDVQPECLLDELQRAARTGAEWFEVEGSIKVSEPYFVIPTHPLRDVRATIHEYDEHIHRNGHSVQMIVFDDSTHANVEKYLPQLEQT